MKDGLIAYQGSAEGILPYFNKLGHQIPEFCNPFDFCLTILQNPDSTADDLNASYEKQLAIDVASEKERLSGEYKSTNEELLPKNLEGVSWFKQFFLLLHRSYINYLRNRSVFLARIFQYCFNTLIIMGFYFGIGTKDNIFANLLGLCFNITNNFFINGMFTSLFMVPVIRRLLKREYSAKLYSISAFYISFLFLLLLPAFLVSIIFSPVIYYSIQMEVTPILLLYFFCVNFFVYLLGELFGLACGAILGDQLSLVVSPMFFVLFLLGSGFFRTNNSFPAAIKWLNWISPYKYLIEIYLSIEQNYNLETNFIAEKMGYLTGVQDCIIILTATIGFIIVLGFIAVRAFSIKF